MPPTDPERPVEEPLFVMRVKLPESSGYASCPSGDADYEEARRKALMKAKPPGFEIKYPRAGIVWPVDSEGMTWVPLYCTDRETGLNHWRSEAFEWKDRYDRIMGKLKGIVQ